MSLVKLFYFVLSTMIYCRIRSDNNESPENNVRLAESNVHFLPRYLTPKKKMI